VGIAAVWERKLLPDAVVATTRTDKIPKRFLLMRIGMTALCCAWGGTAVMLLATLGHSLDNSVMLNVIQIVCLDVGGQPIERSLKGVF